MHFKLIFLCFYVTVVFANNSCQLFHREICEIVAQHEIVSSDNLKSVVLRINEVINERNLKTSEKKSRIKNALEIGQNDFMNDKQQMISEISRILNISTEELNEILIGESEPQAFPASCVLNDMQLIVQKISDLNSLYTTVANYGKLVMMNFDK
jgi:hypothetical protein